jgi:hypothetical protein
MTPASSWWEAAERLVVSPTTIGVVVVRVRVRVSGFLKWSFHAEAIEGEGGGSLVVVVVGRPAAEARWCRSAAGRGLDPRGRWLAAEARRSLGLKAGDTAVGGRMAWWRIRRRKLPKMKEAAASTSWILYDVSPSSHARCS